MKQSKRYSPEVRQRAVRMVFEHQGAYALQWPAIGSIAGKFGCMPETLRNWVRQAGRDHDAHIGSSYDNALAETVIGLFKTEVIRCCGPWRHLEAFEFAIHDWSTGSIISAFSVHRRYSADRG